MSSRGTARTLVAFLGEVRAVRGLPPEVSLALYARRDGSQMLVLDESAGYQIDLDVSESASDVVECYAEKSDLVPAAAPARRRGRTKLDVFGPEVVLLPRHWACLDIQGGDAWAALRRLEDQERKRDAGKLRARHAQDGKRRLMALVADNRGGFEEACRALYAGDDERFLAHAQRWPLALREVVETSAADTFTAADRRSGRSS